MTHTNIPITKEQEGDKELKDSHNYIHSSRLESVYMRPYLKKTTKKLTGDAAQLAQCTPRMHKAIHSMSQTA